MKERQRFKFPQDFKSKKKIIKGVDFNLFCSCSNLWQIQFNILPQISHTFYRIKRNNEVLFLLI